MAWAKDSKGNLVHVSDFVYSVGHSIQLREVVRASAAAPTFLPTATVVLRGQNGQEHGRLRCLRVCKESSRACVYCHIHASRKHAMVAIVAPPLPHKVPCL